METIAKYRNWEVKADYTITKATYDSVRVGSPEKCTCGDCNIYVKKYRDLIFPREFKNFLHELGVDHKKEAEIHCFHHFYEGWFHVKGEIISKGDSNYVVTGRGYKYDTKTMPGNFDIVIIKGSDLHYFDNKYKNDLLEIHFTADFSKP